MKAEHTGIAVLEGKWWRDWNSSVRDTFNMIAEMTCENAHAYHYEMANSLSALDEAIPRIAKDRKCKYLYLATHGNDQSLELFNGERIEMSHLRSLLVNLPSGAKFVGIYLAACSTANLKIATSIFEEDTKLNWMAGYSKDVDWLPSSALDMLFFNELIYAPDERDSNKIRHVAERLRMLAPGLIEELGFAIFVKNRGVVSNLLADHS